MNVQINQLVKSLLQKESLDQCSVQELQQFADRNPYFGAAQLLLTKKLQTENNDLYNEQLQKTFLFFHNPLWVEQLLSETGNATIIKAESQIADTITTPVPVESENKEQEFVPAEIEIATARSEEPVTEIQTPKEAFAKEEMLFEPFHTVDYFASQGIKFKEEEKPKDKLGQQLKSFTDWLRTMKRLPVSEITIAVESKAEQKVEQLAEHSLQDREVLTEAMAEVWEKQGNADKAIEIYNKLSLLDPSKSVYFASKIEDLKKRI
jgi:tetratricopeptide (TPR) repeat protein